MATNILITGGAGFIGSHLADELLANGYTVRVLDNLLPQVHGLQCIRPTYLDPQVELVLGDVRDADVVEKALQGIDAVYHFAAAVETGQSMCEVADYLSINNLGTAVLLDALARHPVERLIVASSKSIYGEGAYQTPDGEWCIVHPRSREQLQRRAWDLHAPDGRPVQPVPTPEFKLPEMTSVYALSKYDQESLCRMVGETCDIPTVVLRFFNVYGPRQSPASPTMGVLMWFAASYLRGQPPHIFEDGQQQRDFVHVRDVARACRLALETPAAAGQIFNIGSGQPHTIRSVAEQLAAVLDLQHIQPHLLNQYRPGDIRHCFADIFRARQVLGYEPRIALRAGLLELASWLDEQLLVNEVGKANTEHIAWGLGL